MNVMEQNRTEGMQKGPASFNQSTEKSVGNSISRGRDAIGSAATDAMDSAGGDLKALQNDLNNLKDTVMKFISQAGSEAAKSAHDITSNVAGQVGTVATDMANRGADLASAATEQAKGSPARSKIWSGAIRLARWRVLSSSAF
jgi:ElaB/YqjD/DUF883 family membrane-anchored ribosome-binding protein